MCAVLEADKVESYFIPSIPGSPGKPLEWTRSGAREKEKDKVRKEVENCYYHQKCLLPSLKEYYVEMRYNVLL